MSNFITNSLIRPLAQWYSEINSATLTGAIDVLVIEQEDGTFVSSPFHVRFGKLGVLKAKEKIVDIEINDEPADIHMKLDDHGTAFFVEDVSESEDEEIPPDLATSPIPGCGIEENFNSSETNVNRSLMDEFNACDDKTNANIPHYDTSIGIKEESKREVLISGFKGKLNRKKRKRRQLHKHSRSGSKTSLREMLASDQSSESSESSTKNKHSDKQEEIFDMDDNDNDGDLDEDDNESTPINSAIASTPKDPQLTTKISYPVSNKSSSIRTLKNETSDESSFLQSRLGDEAIESILETQKIMESHEELAPKSPGHDYYSEPELHSPMESRSRSPVLSDTEYEMEKKKGQNDQQSWEWGQLPTTTMNEVQDSKKSNKGTENSSETDRTTADKQKSWWFWKSSERKEDSRNSNEKEVPGVYLDDLKDDEEMISLYVGSSRHDPTMVSSSVPLDDDAESGNGPSLPMSPHSVEGAIGGQRIRYDSSDEEQKHIGGRLLPEVSFSLCGGLDTEVFSPLLFEQSLISFDDFVMKLRNNENIFENENLVVKIGDQYYNWTSACPMIMSTMLYGRKLPSDLVKVMQVSPQSKGASPNSKITRSSSWWPFSSRKDAELQETSDKLEHEVKKTESEKDVIPEDKENRETKEGIEIKVEPKQEIMPSNVEDVKSLNKVISESWDGSEPDLTAVTTKRRRFKKSMRLMSDSVKKLNLKPGANEAQFSVTTAYQGTSRCKCHIYWWKSTDKIVISDIDGTITKSDVLGHVLPIIGRDWAQSGVASLFSKIAKNGYHIAYLSARAIGQASITKDYLASIRQGDIKLPDGPLFLNPTSLVNAFHREVIEKKPEKFKIACLRDIQKLFPPDSNPFYAGYGNRSNDVFAYRSVGIPISRIFTINSKGELRHELTQTFLTSYSDQCLDVDRLYPSHQFRQSLALHLETSAKSSIAVAMSMVSTAFSSSPRRKTSDFDDNWNRAYQGKDEEIFVFSSQSSEDGDDSLLLHEDDSRISEYGDAVSRVSSLVQLSEFDS